MAKIRLSNFRGMIPRLEDRYIPEGNAITCRNANFERGSLAPDYDLTLVQDLGATAYRRFYKQDDQWILWTTSNIDVVRAEIADSDHRIFWTGDSYPKQTNYTLYPTDRRLGIPAPTNPLTITIQGTGDGVVAKTVSYVYTLVDQFGSESAPSPASAVTEVEGGEYIKLTNFDVPDIGDNDNDIDYVRVYRLESDSSGNADYMMIGVRPGSSGASEVQDVPSGSLPNTTSSVYDCNSTPDALTDNVYETLPSENWVPAPDTSHSLIQFSNGILACADGNEIMVSDPFVPYGYPLDYRMVTQADIVGLGVFRESLIIPTEDYPYALHGSDPSTMMFEKLNYKQSCIWKRSIVSTDMGVFYASPDGLFRVDTADGKLVTEHLITKDQWVTDYVNTEVFICEYDGELYGFQKGTNKIFILDLDNPDSVRWIELDTRYQFYDTLYDAESDTLYSLVYNTTTSTYQIVSLFTNSTALMYFYKSYIITYPAPLCFSVARVYHEGGWVGFGVETENGNLYKASPTSGQIFRLSPILAREFSFELQGTSTITDIEIATSVEELTRDG